MGRKNQADRSNSYSNPNAASGDLPDFIDQTIAVWQPYADRPLTREDAREIAHNVIGFFRVLREWAEEEERSTAAAESSPPVLP